MAIQHDDKSAPRAAVPDTGLRLPEIDRASLSVDRYAIKITGELTRQVSSLGRTLLHPEAREVEGFESATLIYDAASRMAKRLVGGASDKGTLAEAQDMLRRVESFTKTYKEQFPGRGGQPTATADPLEGLSMPKYTRS